MICDFLIR